MIVNLYTLHHHQSPLPQLIRIWKSGLKSLFLHKNIVMAVIERQDVWREDNRFLQSIKDGEYITVRTFDGILILKCKVFFSLKNGMFVYAMYNPKTDRLYCDGFLRPVFDRNSRYSTEEEIRLIEAKIKRSRKDSENR